MADEMIAEISLRDNALYIVKDGKIERVEGPPDGYGKQTVTWQHGKPSHIEMNYSKKIL